ncbi:hypothetical protein BJ944DRAFT_287050 [Cunninghamella echinulata]|nr:hypothetical protein BJ944DRAFT_287050 [Cunninghamella echinulata]
MPPINSSNAEKTPQARHPSFIPVDLPKKRGRPGKGGAEPAAKKIKERRKNGKIITNSIWTSAIIKDQGKKRYGVVSGFYGKGDDRNWTEVYQVNVDDDIDLLYTLAVIRAIQKWEDNTSPLTIYTASRELILAIADGESLALYADLRDQLTSLISGRMGMTHVRCVSTRVSECRMAHELASKLPIDESTVIQKVENHQAENGQQQEEKSNENNGDKNNSDATTKEQEITQQNGTIIEQKETVIVEVEEKIQVIEYQEKDVEMTETNQQNEQEEKGKGKEKNDIIQDDRKQNNKMTTDKVNGNENDNSNEKEKEKEDEEMADEQLDEIEDSLENSSSWSIGLNIRGLLDVLKSPFRRANSDVGPKS